MQIWSQTVPKPPGSTVDLPSAQVTRHDVFLTHLPVGQITLFLSEGTHYNQKQ